MEDKWRWIAITAIAPIAWGSNYYVTRELLPAGSPLWMSALRALPAGLIVLALAREKPHGAWWWRSAVLGTLNVGAFFVLIYATSKLLPTSMAATVMATSAAVLMLLAWPLLGERPARLPVIGAVVGLVGVAVMLLESGSSDVHPLGVLTSLGAMFMSSLGFVLTKRWAGEVRTLSLTAWQLVAGGTVLLVVATAVEGTPPTLDASASLGLVYVVVIATAVAYVAWISGLRKLPAGSVGLIGLLNPLSGVLLGTVVAHEVFGWRQAVGTALVIGGVLIGQRVRRPKPAADEWAGQPRVRLEHEVAH